MFKNSSIHFAQLGKIFVSILLFTFFLTYYSNFIQSIPYAYSDEYYVVGGSFFFDLFISGDWKNPIWNSVYGYDQGKLAEYFFGFILYPEYQILKKARAPNYDFAEFLIDHNIYFFGSEKYEKYEKYKESLTSFINLDDDNANKAEYLLKYGPGIQKTLDLYNKARVANTYVLALTIIICFLIGCELFSSVPAALIGAIAYGLNPIIIQVCVPALSEALLLFFFNTSILLILQLFNTTKVRARLKISYLLGIAIGLATQAKINALMLLGMFGFLVGLDRVFYFFQKREKIDMIKNILMITMVCEITFFIFISLNPYLHENPYNNTINMFRHRYSATDWVKIHLPESYIPTVPQRFYRIIKHFFSPEDNVLYNGITPLVNYESINLIITRFTFIFGILAVLVGMAMRRIPKSLIIFFVCFLFIMVVSSIYINLDWARYYDHLVIFFVFFEIYGIYSTVQVIKILTSKALKLIKLREH